MNGFDILFLIVLALGAWKGWSGGFLREVLALIGVFLGLFVAYKLYEQVGFHIAPYINVKPTYANIIAFALIFIGVPVLLGWLASLLTKFMEWAGLESVNRLGGVIVCVVKYAVILGAVCNVLSITHLVTEEAENNSILFKPLKQTTSVAFELAKKQWKGATEMKCDD